MSEVNLKVTANSGEVTSLRKEIETLKKEIRELKAGFAGMGVDADAAMGKTQKGIDRIKASFEKYSAAVVAGTANQSAAYNRDLERFKAKCLAENAEREKSIRVAAGQLALQKQSELKANADGLAAFKAKCLAENAATLESFKQKTLATNKYVSDTVRANERLSMSRLELARANKQERLDEAKALRDAGHMTPAQYQAVKRGISHRFGEESGQAAEQRRRIRDEERQRQSDQQAGIRLVEQHATAQERFNVRIAKATQLKKDQHISEAVFKREVAAANKELREQTSLFGPLATAAASYVTVAAGVALAWRTASSAYQNYLDVQKESKDASVEFGDEMREAKKNLPSLTHDQVKTAALKISKQAGVLPNTVMKTITGLGSSKGASSDADMLEATQVALELNPNDASKASGVGSAILQEKTRHPKRGIREIAGLFQAAKAIGIENDEEYHEYVAGALSEWSDEKRGNTFQELAALRGTMATKMGDSHARVSTNAFRAFMVQLETVMADTPGGFETKLAALQKHPDRRHKLLGAFDDKVNLKKGEVGTKGSVLEEETIKGELRGLMTIVDFIKQDPETMALYQRQKALMPATAAEAEKVLSDYQASTNSSPDVQLSNRVRSDTATQERLKLIGRTGAGTAAQRERLDKHLKSSGLRGDRAFATRMGFETAVAFGKDARGSVSGALRSRVKELYAAGDPESILKAKELEANIADNDAAAKSEAEVQSRLPDKNDIYRRAADGVNRKKGLTIEQRREKIDYFDSWTSASGGRTPEHVTKNMFKTPEDQALLRELIDLLKSQAENAKEPVVNLQVAPGLQVKNNNKPVAPRASARLGYEGGTLLAGGAF